MSQERDPLGRKSIRGIRAVVVAGALIAGGFPLIGRQTEANPGQPNPQDIAARFVPDIPDTNREIPFPFPRPEMRGRGLVNGGFEHARRIIDRVTRTIRYEPVGWEPVGNANYNYRDGSGNGSPSSVSGDLIAHSGPFGCEFEGGAWQTSGLIRVNPNNTYEFSYAAKHKLLSLGDVLHSSEVEIYNASRQLIFDIASNPSDPQENTYVFHKAVTIGPNGQLPWLEDAAFVRLRVYANGVAVPGCVDGTKVAEVFYDDVYFGPVR